MADIVTMAQEELRERGAADAAALAAKAVDGSADGTALIDQEDTIPTWRQRDYSQGWEDLGSVEAVQEVAP